MRGEIRTKKDEWAIIFRMKDHTDIPMRQWCRLCEYHYSTDSLLSETVYRTGSDSKLNQMLGYLEDLSCEPIVGGRYIPVMVFETAARLDIFDVGGNNPPQLAPRFMELTRRTATDLVFDDNGTERKFPEPYIGSVMKTRTFCYESAGRYNALITMLELLADSDDEIPQSI